MPNAASEVDGAERVRERRVGAEAVLGMGCAIGSGVRLQSRTNTRRVRHSQGPARAPEWVIRVGSLAAVGGGASSSVSCSSSWSIAFGLVVASWSAVRPQTNQLSGATFSLLLNSSSGTTDSEKRVLARLREGAGEAGTDEAGEEIVDLDDDWEEAVAEEEEDEASELRVRFPRTMAVSRTGVSWRAKGRVSGG